MESNKTELPLETGKYTELSLIGEGGCAKVFKAFDPALERYVALKLLSQRFNADEAMREQFFKEIKLQAGLNIPGIVRVFDCGDSPHGLYYTMELVNGTCLEKYCWDNHLTLQNKFSLIGDIAGIIGELHKKGMLHRDIKPRNVMIDEYGHVKLLDLGLVTLLEDEMTLINDFQISGSPAYMPPEALNDKKVNSITTAADIYSLSVMTYEMICVFLPYELDFLSLKELSEVISSETPKTMETPFKEKIPAKVEQIIKRGLSINPAERPSAFEFAKVMKAFSVENKGNTAGRVAAVIVVSGISVGIIYQLLSGPESEIQNNVIAPRINTPPVIKTVETKVTAVPKVVSNRKTFYKNSAPEDLQTEWKALKHELATDSSFAGMGALYYSLPDKCFITFKTGETTLRSIDSRFESSGSLFYKSGDKLTIELKKNSWLKPVIISWMPVAGNADVFCPDKNSFNEKKGETK
ncbi:MAG: serine/threonine protein kinase [Victivallales bacterium]|nr:serine/threonine protein kinase [Victivallales bacterium]